MKLKTLKDIDCTSIIHKAEDRIMFYKYDIILKQEAIKDIKFLRKIKKNDIWHPTKEIIHGIVGWETLAIETYIMWKFNIAEEELK